MTAMVFHQPHVTQWQSLFTLISNFDIVSAFILISSDKWLLFCMTALRIVSVNYLSHMKQKNQSIRLFAGGCLCLFHYST